MLHIISNIDKMEWPSHVLARRSHVSDRPTDRRLPSSNMPPLSLVAMQSMSKVEDPRPLGPVHNDNVESIDTLNADI